MFKISRIVLSLALAGAAIVPALAVQQDQPEAAFRLAAAARVTDKANGFSVIPPAGWERGAPSPQAFMMYLAAPKNNFRTNFNVNVSKDDGTPVSKLGAIIKPAFKQEFAKWKLMGEGTITISGQPCYYISSRFSIQDPKDINAPVYDIQNLQYYIRGKKGRFYVLTFTAQFNEYKANEATFRQVAASVQTLN